MFGNNWARAEATVVAKEKRPQNYGHAQEYNYLIDVRPADGPPIRTTIHYGFRAPDGGFADPAIGDTIGVLYDAKRGKVKFDVDDPRLSLAADKNAEADAFAAAQAAEPGTPPPAAGPVVRTIVVGEGTGDPADRLEKLEKLRRSGLIDEASYRSARDALGGPAD
jgi:hypothetical protein